MPNKQFKKNLKFDKPATYRIRVVGHIDDSLSDQLGGMIITRAFTANGRPLTILVGYMRDQAALSGTLNELYELHLPLLTVESLPNSMEQVLGLLEQINREGGIQSRLAMRNRGGSPAIFEYTGTQAFRLRHPRGMLITVPFGDMQSVTNYTRDYVIMKLDFRVRYDTDVEKVRKIIKRINKEIQADEELSRGLMDKIKSQGVREMDDSAMIMRVKFVCVPGEQFVIRREVYRRIQEAFQKNGIEFAHRNVTVYFPPETGNTETNSQEP